MKTDITVSIMHEKIFKESCDWLSIEYEVVEELEDDNVRTGTKFRLTHQPTDLYFLGRHMGLQIGQNIVTDVFKK